MNVDLSLFENSYYKPGRSSKRVCWYILSHFFVNTYIPFPATLKINLLRLFGAKIGKGTVVKPGINIKYPWFLTIGDNVWLGENVWIDNLAQVSIGSNVCLSQGCYLLTGNHDYKKISFDLIVKPIVIEAGSWVGAKSIVCPGVVLATNSIITAGSVITKSTLSDYIYQGNPAIPVRKRIIES
ncbi:MAG: colanic acid biosynthesis acetyltransferase WcaF [Candidatus Margulisiibacteriota bacterium]|nr:MAG: colanic acid biosynthesis acetyltransferase WcaF [Candidatus Margulisiibacteriota bacterium]